MANERVLVVEDDRDLSYIVKLQLKKRGFIVTCAASYKATKELLMENKYDLVILDIRLPDADGIDVCREIRRKLICPIIFTSCIGDRDTIIKALEKGGDDYIVKPVDMDLLIARIYAALRRSRQFGYKERKKIDKVYFNQFMIEQSSHTVWRINSLGEKLTIINLSPIEYKILVLFTENEDILLEYEEIYRYVWETDSLDDIRTVMVHVSNLRKKIKGNGKGMIRTVRGSGYIFSGM